MMSRLLGKITPCADYNYKKSPIYQKKAINNANANSYYIFEAPSGSSIIIPDDSIIDCPSGCIYYGDKITDF